jgi:hypothetical protein
MNNRAFTERLCLKKNQKISEDKLRLFVENLRGRARAVAHFTHESVAAATVKVYREMMGR